MRKDGPGATSRRALARSRPSSTGFNAISAEMAEPDADFDALMTEMGKLGGDRPRRRVGPGLPSSSRPWMPCGARHRTPTSRRSPVVSAVALPSAKLLLQKPACCLTSPPTTWTPSRSSGSSSTSPSIPAPSSPSPTTAISWTTSRVDPRTRPGPPAPHEGKHLTYLGENAARLGGPGQGRQTGQTARRRNPGALQRQGAPGQVEGPSGQA